MPIKGWLCDEHGKVPFGHFNHCKAERGGKPHASPALVSYAERKILSDVRHALFAVSATRVLTCPRQVFLECFFDYWIHPKKLALRDRGSALHEVLGSTLDPNVWMSESRERVQLTVEGELFGVRMSAQADAIRRDLSEIVDMKFPSDFTVKFRDNSAMAKSDHQVQLNIIRLLLAQQEWAVSAGYDPETVEMSIWDHACGPTSAPAVMRVNRMTEEQMMEYRPGDGRYDITSIVDQFAWAMGEMQHRTIRRGTIDDDVEAIAAQLPLVGETMFKQKKCTQYCDVESTLCSPICRRFGRPADTALLNIND